MFVRKSLAGAVAAAVAGTALAVAAGPASAAYTPDADDTAFTPVAADMIGVGSDTSQNALLRIANAYNAASPAPTVRMSTFAATGGGDIPLPNGTIGRPNGSGAGKGLLYGAGNNVGVDFARSSSAISTAEASAGLQAFPFALDTLKMAVSGSVASHAPAGLTGAQIVKIYDGTYKNWSEVGGTAGVIAPKIPQAGSGTRSFFVAQLQAANNGVAVTLAASVAEVQEHDPAQIQNNPDAIAPYSAGRAGLTPSLLRLETGFAADRALYNVVRGTDLGNADIQKMFGETGFACSEAARPAIEAAGFKQLAKSSNGGVCGVATQAATSNFKVTTIANGSDDTTFVPTTADVIGVGSDTSQNALYRLATSYNATSPAPTVRLATFAALGSAQIALPSGAINRPNGSGAGKGLLYGAANNTDVDFARSSAALSTAEVSAGLQAFPFALDTLKMAVSGSVASHAPAALTGADIVKIYDGTYTNWSQLGGTAGVIAPKIPQAGSGTRSFFVAQLTAANNGVAVTLAASVAEVQEHDPAQIQNNPDAVAPYSAGRAGLTPGLLRLETGFSADRALYNVVRGNNLGNADIQKIFGETGFVCSDAAADEITAAGFKQLDSLADGGVCGVATQAATTNFDLNEPVFAVPTTTKVTAANPSPRALRLVAKVTGSTTPTGTVTFKTGTTTLGTVGLIGGTGTLNKTVAPGSYPITATYAPTAGTDFVASAGSAVAAVKTSSALKESFKSVVKGAAKAKGVVTVTLAGTAAKATGKVTIKKGAKVVGTGTVKAGKVTITLVKAKLAKGKNTLKIAYVGNALAFGSTKTFTITKK